jgi:two-component system cell cycle response regulator
VRSRDTILREARQQLRKKEITPEERERLLNLLSLLISGMGEEVLQNEDFSTLLLETVLNNGNLVNVVERQAAELDALKHITRNLTSTLDLQVVLDQVVQEAMYLIKDSHEAHIYLYEDNQLVFGAALDEEGTKNRQVSDPRPNGLSTSVVRQKTIIVIEDMETDVLFASASKTWKGSIIGIPLMMGERVVGIMNLVRNRKGEFTQAEIRLLTMLADQAAIAINNANLHEVVNRQARSDTVTRLPNRRALDERLDEAIRHSNRSGLAFTVVMMDLDGFKIVNDTYGHDIGDDVLRQIADSLRNTLRTTDFLARYGGDEMTLVLSDTDLPQAGIVTQKIQNQLLAFDICLPNRQTMKMTVSGGIAFYPKHANSAPGLIRAADEALYYAKKHARGTFMVAPSRTGELHTTPDTSS